VVVNVREKGLGGPIVEFAGEGKTANTATAVVDRFTGKIQYLPLRFDAAFVKIHYAKQGARIAADLAATRTWINDREHRN
jgi:hypothetical protein